MAVVVYNTTVYFIFLFLSQGPGRVKEGEENVLVSRLQVSDEDTMGSAAWRAKFKIDGDTRNNFRITTNAETNEGLLYVEKVFLYVTVHFFKLLPNNYFVKTPTCS